MPDRKEEKMKKFVPKSLALISVLALLLFTIELVGLTENAMAAAALACDQSASACNGYCPRPQRCVSVSYPSPGHPEVITQTCECQVPSTSMSVAEEPAVVNGYSGASSDGGNGK